MLYTSQAYMDKFADIGDYGMWIAQYADNKATGYQQNPWNEGAYLCAVRQYNGIMQPDLIYPGQRILIKEYGFRVGNQQYYKICSGDTLEGIAARFGRSRQELQMWNNIGNPNYILAGDTIRVG